MFFFFFLGCLTKIVYAFATCVADALFQSGESKQRAILDMRQATEVLDTSSVALGKARNIEDSALNHTVQGLWQTFSKSTFCPHSVFMCFVWI